MLIALLFALGIGSGSFTLHAAEPAPADLLRNAPRTTFVQMFEWPWKDVARECERYLGPAGFSAVQVSPPTEHMVWDGSPWWERYQPVSYRLLSRSGDEAEFREMIRRCRAVGVDIYVDVVINHMAGIDNGRGQAGSIFSHYEYPGLYGFDDFHHCGRNRGSMDTFDNILNFFDRYEVQNCELVNLADLATEKPNVRRTLTQYLNYLMSMGVSGFRVDAAKHVPAQDIQAIFSGVRGRPYVVQEVIVDPGEPITADEYLRNGDVTIFNYAYHLGAAFHGHELWKLQSVGRTSGYPDSWFAVVFLENHDLQRHSWAPNSILSFQYNSDLAALGHVFMLGWPYGYPQIYSSYRFGSYDQGPPVDPHRNTIPVLSYSGDCRAPWICEHRNPEVAPMVQFRNLTNGAFVYTDWWADGDRLAFGRGEAGFVVINAGEGWLKKKFQTSLPPGVYCNILDSSYDLEAMNCSQGRFTVQNDRTVYLEVPPKKAMAFHFGARNRELPGVRRRR